MPNDQPEDGATALEQGQDPARDSVPLRTPARLSEAGSADDTSAVPLRARFAPKAVARTEKMVPPPRPLDARLDVRADDGDASSSPDVDADGEAEPAAAVSEPDAETAVAVDTTPELELIERAKHGERAAFGVLYERHVDAVFRYCLTRLGNRTDAEELTSEVFHRSLEAIPRFEPRRPFLAFLYTIARNAIADKARRTKPMDHSEDPFATIASADPGPAQVAVQTDRASRVREAIRTLTPLQQEVVVMRFIEGLSYEEVAKATGKPASTIRGIQMRALASLKDTLGGDA